MTERILLVGNGGREHALAWALSQSPRVQHIYVAPGNGGTASAGKNIENVNITKFDDLVKFAVEKKITLVIPGPEAPLVEGIRDYFEERIPRVKVFGPTKDAAQMEGSKAFAKDFMKRHNIPTAAYENFTDYKLAQQWLDSHRDMKVVIKASGLAAGKGVIIPTSHEEASDALKSIMLEKEFGEAGDSVVIEEFLEGEELSVLSFSDGHTIQSLPAAQDHKRVYDNDEGPNTGGMGAYAPIPIYTSELEQRIHREVLQPTIDGMLKERMPFRGVLFTGFMVTPAGEPKVLEYNVRFGDPETQTLLPLLDSDLCEIMLACCGSYLAAETLSIKNAFSATVVAAAGGYPGSYSKGTKMTLQPPAPSTYIFHAGTSLDSSNTLVTSGGRVIAATATASTIHSAVDSAYKGISTISFDKMHFRHDIAHRALNRRAPSPTAPTAPSTSTSSTSSSKPKSKTPLTYATSGVSVDAGNEVVSRIRSAVASTARPGASCEIGGFGGDLDLAAAGYSTAPRIVSAIDGIGTKILVALALGDASTVGIDLVAMNVNDLLVQGAEPLKFLDYYGCSKLVPGDVAAFVEGVAEGCRRANCALVGGETAEMPGLYQGADFDAAGCAIGALRKERKMLPDVEGMKEGDVLLGVASSGVHSNGFSLVRKIVEASGLKYTDPCPWLEKSEGGDQEGMSLGRALLTPTRIYVRSFLKALKYWDANTSPIKAMSHITGGGLIDNIPRMFGKSTHLAAKVNIGSWPVPPVFKWLKNEGAVPTRDFARTWNTGLGMVVVVDREGVEEVEKALREEGEKVWRIGELVRRSEVEGREGYEEGCLLEGLRQWDSL